MVDLHGTANQKEGVYDILKLVDFRWIWDFYTQDKNQKNMF